MRAYTATLRVEAHGMGAHGAFPAAPKPAAAVVVVMHAPGVDTFVHGIVERLANAGYAALAPDLYHRQSEPGTPAERRSRLLDSELITDLNAAIAHLRAQPEVDGARIGILGFCMGGRVAWLMAAANPDLRAAAIYYGGNIMVPWGASEPSPYERAITINCPILFHFGGEDENPSPADRVRLEETLTRHGKTHEFYSYSGAGHAFMNFTSAERYRAAAAEASWPRTLDFFSRHLRA